MQGSTRTPTLATFLRPSPLLSVSRWQLLFSAVTVVGYRIVHNSQLYPSNQFRPTKKHLTVRVEPKENTRVLLVGYLRYTLSASWWTCRVANSGPNTIANASYNRNLYCFTLPQFLQGRRFLSTLHQHVLSSFPNVQTVYEKLSSSGPISSSSSRFVESPSSFRRIS